MFFYSRKIGFVDYYINGVKSGNVGVVRQKVTSEGLHLSVELSGLEHWSNFCSQVYVGSAEGKRNVFQLDITGGNGRKEVLLPFSDIKGSGKLIFKFGNDCYGVTELCEVPEELLMHKKIEKAVIEKTVQKEEIKEEETNEEEKTEEKIKEEPQEMQYIQGEINAETLSDEEEELLEECMEPQPDKWEMIKRKYPILYPFRGQGPYVSIKPVDLQLLQGKYHSLAENSFLMHAFYQYRNLILGEYSMDGNTYFYVGVPGEFAKKEQTAAAMFGFEGYEYSGDLGYYLYRVEL